MISTEEKFVFQKIVTGIILLFSVCLLVIAWPRSRAALDFLPAKYALEKINKNEVLEEEDIATALEQTEQSAGIFADPRYSEGMSQLLLLDAQNNEQIVGQDHVKLFGITHQLHGTVIGQHMVELHIGIVAGMDVGHDLTPEQAAFHDIGLFRTGDAIVTAAGQFKGDTSDALDLAGRIDLGVKASALTIDASRLLESESRA